MLDLAPIQLSTPDSPAKAVVEMIEQLSRLIIAELGFTPDFSVDCDADLPDCINFIALVVRGHGLGRERRMKLHETTNRVIGSSECCEVRERVLVTFK